MAAPTRSGTEQHTDRLAEARRWVAESRARQGLPPTVRNRDALRLVAAAVRAPQGRADR